MNATQKKSAPKAEDVSILAWVLNNKIKSEKGEELVFTDRLFLLDILTDWSEEIVWKKCSQVGGSVVFNLKVFFAVMKMRWNVIYTMPTDGDVEEFVKTKTNPLIRENPQVFEGVASDSIYLKQIGKANLHMKGTISKTAAISTSADAIVNDEISRSDQSVVKTYESRLKASAFKRKWKFSNPTTEKDALDEGWQQSDQKEWFVKCDNGHKEVLTWPESVDKERQCFQCKVCKILITDEQRRKGHWKKTRESEISGYHTSHLMAPWISAKEIIKDSEGDQEYFYNFVLGEPYNPGDLSITRSLILDNWTPKDLSKGKEWFLGVDVGNIKWFVLGTELGVVKVGKFTKWQDLEDMMAMYNPTLVIDANPDNTMARYFVEKYRGARMSVFMENQNNPQTILWWGEHGENDTPANKGGIVYSNRNRILDQLIDHILQAGIRFGVPSDRDFQEYVAHWLTLRRIKETNARGIERYVWESTNSTDHYVFATLYYYIALQGRGQGAVFPQVNVEQPIIITTDNKIVDSFDDILEASGYANTD